MQSGDVRGCQGWDCMQELHIRLCAEGASNTAACPGGTTERIKPYGVVIDERRRLPQLFSWHGPQGGNGAQRGAEASANW